MLRDYMAKTAQLEQFDEELYKVTDDGERQTEKYLIATSEQPLSALHDGEWLQDKDLPIKCVTECSLYLSDADKISGMQVIVHAIARRLGRTAKMPGVSSESINSKRSAKREKLWGARSNALLQIEQFLLTKPEDSWESFDAMIQISEEFYKSLGIPYQVVAIVSGALNNAAAKKYDLEAWFPYQQEYKELVSCSNCTDYQSRALDIRYGAKGPTDIKKKYVHALNSTLCATERALCCVLENYQTETVSRICLYSRNVGLTCFYRVLGYPMSCGSISQARLSSSSTSKNCLSTRPRRRMLFGIKIQIYKCFCEWHPQPKKTRKESVRGP